MSRQSFTQPSLRLGALGSLIRPPFAMEAFSDLEDDVRQSVARIKASPFVPHKDAIGGFVYEVETGRLREVK